MIGNNPTVEPHVNECGRLKELEHRKLGWKVLILKYDLGKSLNKEMWCKMTDTKNIDYIFQQLKNAWNMR